MQNQQIFTKILELEQELRKIKSQIKKKPMKKAAPNIWSKLNFLDLEIEEAKRAVLGFDIERFVKKQDLVSWR